MRCDSCGRDKETVEQDGRHLCLACLRAGESDNESDRKGPAGLDELKSQYVHVEPS